MDVTSDKEQVRSQARLRRQTLAAEIADAAERFAAQTVALNDLIPSGAVVAGYWPLGDEADPRGVMGALEKGGYELALPAVDGEDTPLVFRRFSIGQPLVEGAFRVMEPTGDAPVVRPRAVILPLLAFDEAGFRLGYGGGYYDRTLERLRRDGPTLAVGLAFAGQRVAHLPHEDHDEPLDAVVTENGVIRFEHNNGRSRP